MEVVRGSQKMKSTGFANGLVVGQERKGGVKDDTRVLP